MGWNDSVSKILRFIPVFERDVKAVTALTGELKEAIKRCEDVAEENRLLTLENQTLKSSNEISLKALTEKLVTDNKLLQKGLVESSELAVKEVKRSFKELSEKVSTIESKEVEFQLYDDTEINKRIDDIKFPEYDDSELIERIKKVELKEVPVYDDSKIIKRINDITFPAFDDTELLERIGRFEGMFDSFRRSEGEQFALAISKVNKRLKEIKPYDDSKVLELIESLQRSFDSINEYDDTKLIEAVNGALSKIDNFAPYDDLAVKKAIKDIRSRLTKLANEVKKHK